MSEAELKIKPVLAWNGGTFKPLIHGLRGVQDVAGRVGRRIRGTIGQLTSLPSMITGVMAYGAGRTLLDKTVGTADDMRTARRQMKYIFADADAAMRRSRQLTNEIASMSTTAAVSGMQSLGVIADGDVERAAELVKLAQALAIMKPEQGLEGASLALKELASGSTQSAVARFDLAKSIFPSAKEAERIAKTEGKKVSDVYIGRLQKYIQDKRGGVEKLLQIDRESMRGNAQMLMTAVEDIGLTVGQQALPQVTASLQDATESLKDLADDPKFQQAAKDFGTFIGEGAESLAEITPTLLEKIPSTFRAVSSFFKDVKDFYDAHPTLVKVAGGLVAANWLTGGLVTEGVGALIGRASGGGAGEMFGGGCCCGPGGAASKADDVADEIASKSFWTKARNWLASGGTTTAALTKGTGVLTGGQVASGLGAMAAPFAVGGLLTSEWADAMGDPDKVQADPMDNLKLGDRITAIVQRGAKSGNFRGIRRGLQDVLGGPNAKFTGRADQEYILDAIQDELGRYGLTADIEKGQSLRQMQFGQEWGWNPFDSDLSDVAGRDVNMQKLVEEMNRPSVQINGNVVVQANNADEFRQSMAKEARKRRSTGS